MSDWEDNKYTIDFYVGDFCSDNYINKNYPRIVNVFERLSNVLTDAIGKVADEVNGDSSIENKAEFKTQVINQLREVVSAKNELKDVNTQVTLLEERLKNIKNTQKL